MPMPAAYNVPMGATVVQGGATFRVWAPTAQAVHLVLAPPGGRAGAGWAPSDATRLAEDGRGFWSVFAAAVGDGWHSFFWTWGRAAAGSSAIPVPASSS